MTAREFRHTLARLGLSQTASCEVLGKSLRTVSRYANNAQPIPQTVAKLLEHKLAARALLEA